MDQNVRWGVAVYVGGKLAASAGCCAGLRRFAAGAAESV